MALSKIQSESINLADNFAFTGTVSGAGAMEHISTTDITTPAQFVVFDNLSTDYDTFVFQYEFHPDTDSAQFGIQFLDSSGTVIADSNAYGYYNDFDGVSISSDDTNIINISANTIGNDTHEGVRGRVNTFRKKLCCCNRHCSTVCYRNWNRAICRKCIFWWQYSWRLK